MFLFLLLSEVAPAQQREFTVAGEFQGKNIYVQNPLTDDKSKFCTQEVFLNDKLVLSKPTSSAYEIDLSAFNIGNPVVIRIVHTEGCTPKIINPQVIRSRSKFQFLTFTLDGNSINWFTTGEIDGGVFYIEQYRNEKWYASKEISAKGSFENNHYSLPPMHHSGDNTYRIKYESPEGKIYYSKVERFFSELEPISFYPTRVDNKIYLSRETPYEVVDTDGKLISHGVSREITLENMESGLYYLKIDNRTEKFFKK
ncbi:MAG: T9SS C-terminal target domain-containing protein [Cyclobacteriaceae bacterium]